MRGIFFHDAGCFRSQPLKVAPLKRRRGADNEAPETKIFSRLSRQQVGNHNIFNIDASVQILVDLQIRIGERFSLPGIIVYLGKES